jgi:hypothetical protein
MLSPDERRRLAELERHLESQDPQLARRLAAGPADADRRRIRTLRLLLVTGVVGVLIGVLVGSPVLVVVIGVIPLLSWVVLRNRHPGGG